jgi:hypothetical protein
MDAVRAASPASSRSSIAVTGAARRTLDTSHAASAVCSSDTGIVS